MPHKCSHVSSVHSHACYTICIPQCSNKAVFTSFPFICSGRLIFAKPTIWGCHFTESTVGLFFFLTMQDSRLKLVHAAIVMHACVNMTQEPLCMTQVFDSISSSSACPSSSGLSHVLTAQQPLTCYSYNDLLFIFKIWLLSNMINIVTYIEMHGISSSKK